MLKIKKMSEVMGRHVYTSEGDYFGQVEDVNLIDNRIDGWKIKLSGGIMNMLGGARGVIIPQQFVRAIGDIFIVNKKSLPIQDEHDHGPAPGASGEALDLSSASDDY